MKNKKELKEKFIPILLGIIFNPQERKILIGRREQDPFVKKLTWTFPGGSVNNNNLEKSLKKQIKAQTGLKTESLGTVFARIPKENKKFVLVYYLCELIGGKEKTSKTFKELKWVYPKELKKYFTTSFDPKLKEYIEDLKSLG
jgi:ADP-ribose pyrophosphatase YjhB (NUDIX family)